MLFFLPSDSGVSGPAVVAFGESRKEVRPALQPAL